MMKYLLKTSGMAALILMLHAPGFAQDKNEDDADSSSDKLGNYDEIVIKHKSSKDAKVTVEIRDNKVFINGKPVTEYNDDNVSVRKKKVMVMDGQTLTFAPSPFRRHGGAMSIDGEGWLSNSNRAFLGVTTEKPDKDGVEGAEIHEISKGSAAAKVGLKVGDIITRVDEITIDGPQSLSEAIHKYKPESKVTLTLKRDGKEQKITVTLGKAPGMSSDNFYKMPDLQNFNFDYSPGMPGAPGVPGAPMPRGYGYSYGGPRARLGIKAQDTEDSKGVKVLEVGDESAAEKAGIKEGDIITRFDGKEVNSATELAELARASKDKSSIKVSVNRDGKAQELEVRIPKKLKTADL
ncbi:PDZ domain-containing protein [Flavitalea sp. BT771]|uniref:PDZ domain-containing protein n=1 Tax=Flavitalea sp. BT771 TaxID=3063329 RepID=UPI0026E34A99|nr:PDZ domain-containing protein [Flavitalea sp. BT771]MDO6434115.1 PDZ domain-containing protein [Flavitalea sp. BT771]MDV6223015.1 PDZ domain-containing protein [Flavitalea sp. BT771]